MKTVTTLYQHSPFPPLRVMRVKRVIFLTTYEKCQRQKIYMGLNIPRYHPHHPQIPHHSPKAHGSFPALSLAGAKRRELPLGRAWQI